MSGRPDRYAGGTFTWVQPYPAATSSAGVPMRSLAPPATTNTFAVDGSRSSVRSRGVAGRVRRYGAGTFHWVQPNPAPNSSCGLANGTAAPPATTETVPSAGSRSSVLSCGTAGIPRITIRHGPSMFWAVASVSACPRGGRPACPISSQSCPGLR